jgi:hypothetical protein
MDIRLMPWSVIEEEDELTLRLLLVVGLAFSCSCKEPMKPMKHFVLSFSRKCLAYFRNPIESNFDSILRRTAVTRTLYGT